MAKSKLKAVIVRTYSAEVARLTKERDEAADERDFFDSERCKVAIAHDALRAENAKLRKVIDEIRSLTWDPEFHGVGATLPKDICASSNKLLRRILKEAALAGEGGE
jgi:hypothetical protein